MLDSSEAATVIERSRVLEMVPSSTQIEQEALPDPGTINTY